MGSATDISSRGYLIGILGMQGCFKPHSRKFTELGCETRRIVYPADLEGCDALILPGGESSTMLKAMTPGLWEALLEFGQSKPMWGICAGCILMARTVRNPEQKSLAQINMVVTRNAYGAQNESFITDLHVAIDDSEFVVEGVFIRAPVIDEVNDGATVLASHNGTPVLVEQGRHMVATFHPELSDSTALHEYFLSKIS